MSNYRPRQYRSPLTQKRTYSSHSAHQNYIPISPTPKDSKITTANKFWTANKRHPQSPIKRPSSLNKPNFQTRKVSRSIRKDQRSISNDFLRQEIQISPDLKGSLKPRQLLKCRIEPSYSLIVQASSGIMPEYQPSRHSKDSNGLIYAYAANTNQGIVRNYNQDRVAIILNIKRPDNVKQQKWKKCSFFGVYDGHGGTAVADFLRDNLHHFIIKDPIFADKPLQAMKAGFARAQQLVIQQAQRQVSGMLQKSGSCAISLMIVGNICYVANVGDSRAIMSCQSGNLLYQLSIDHKPTDPHQQLRIINSGGKIYQTKIHNPGYNINPGQAKSVLGPYRVLPGRLSVTRTFGDPQAKLIKYGGNPNVVTAKPEIKYFEIGLEYFAVVLLPGDGIYDKVSSQQIVQIVWQTARKQKQKQIINVHALCGVAIQNILKLSIARKSADNVTAVIVAFQSFKNKLQKLQVSKVQIREQQNFGYSTISNFSRMNSDKKKQSVHQEWGRQQLQGILGMQRNKLGL